MKIKLYIAALSLGITGLLSSQNSVSSPYSRYALGEPAQQTFAHNAGMGGASIALRPDSTMPIFINAGNPASYALIKLTSLEVGGRYLYSSFHGKASALKKWGTNFAYGALGFPIRSNGGACFGILPFSYVGYDAETNINTGAVGNVQYKYNGNGGLNKAFIGYGMMPFHKSLIKFRKRNLYVPDSVKHLSRFAYQLGNFGAKILSDFSIGFNANYLFGNIINTSRVVYPGSLLYNNTFTQKEITMGDFTGNFGAQTAITIDSVRAGKGKRRALKEKVKFTFGFFTNLNNAMQINYNSIALNYVLNGAGQEIIRDTAYYKIDQKTTMRLPIEQGFGVGFKKSEKLTIVADFAISNWRNFKYVETDGIAKESYRMALGANYVPEKYAAGRKALWRKINYRMGLNYETGYIQINNTLVTNYYLSVGLGIPVGVGRLSSMINVSAQLGQMGTTANGLVKENYFRVNFGFTFSDRWFQKFRYD